MSKLKIWAKFATNRKYLIFLCKYLVDVAVRAEHGMKKKPNRTENPNRQIKNRTGID